MRKSIILIGIFLVLATVALVYGIQYLGNPQSVRGQYNSRISKRPDSHSGSEYGSQRGYRFQFKRPV